MALENEVNHLRETMLSLAMEISILRREKDSWNLPISKATTKSQLIQIQQMLIKEIKQTAEEVCLACVYV